jgi:hypothetical protein
MIQKILNLTAQQRLDNILDKLSSNKKLSKKEQFFLSSWTTGREEEVNYEMNMESGKEFISDDGYFKFIPKQYEEIEDCKIISGTIILPDPELQEMKMTLSGNILVFKRSHVALDFRVNEVEIFEFLGDKEEQLDDFIYEIIETYS